MEAGIADLCQARALRKKALQAVDRRIAETDFALAEAMARLADEGGSTLNPLFTRNNLIQTALGLYSSTGDVFRGLIEVTGRDDYGDILSELAMKERTMEETAAMHTGGIFLSEIVNPDVPEHPYLTTSRESNKRKATEISTAEGDSEEAQRHTENKENDISSQLISEGWHLDKRAHPSIGRLVRFVDLSEVGESVSRPELLLWEEARVYAYLPP